MKRPCYRGFWSGDVQVYVLEYPELWDSVPLDLATPKDSSDEGFAYLVNHGMADIAITQASIVGADASFFSLTAGNYANTTIPAGATLQIPVEFTPTADGVFTNAHIQLDFRCDGLLYTGWQFLPLGGQTLQAELLKNGGITASGSAVAGEKLKIRILHPYKDEIGNPSSSANLPPSEYPVEEGGEYALVSGFGSRDDGGYMEGLQRELQELKESGTDEQDAPVRLLSLHVMGQTWMHETTLLRAMYDRIAGIHNIYHHRFGLMAKEDGYFIDVKSQLSAPVQLGGAVAKTTARGVSLLASAMEHGVLEQLQGTDRPAASTVKVLTLANEQNIPVYRATAENFSALRPALTTGGYTGVELDNFYHSMTNENAVIVLPQSSSVGETGYPWKGKGYVQCGSKGSNWYIGMIIGGGYNGGYAFDEWDLLAWEINSLGSENLYYNVEIWTPESIEPVDMATGAYLFKHTDLSTGGPERLAFARNYNSHQRYVKTSMGYGWTHNLDIHVRQHYAYKEGLGLRTPEDSAALLVACAVINDLVAGNDTPKGWLTAAIAARWATTQLNENAVSIHIGQKTLTFIKQPNGSYTPPPGTTWTLSGESGSFTMQQRNGKTYAFNADNQIHTITDPDGNTLTFNYSDTTLQNVISSFGNKKLTLTYTGDLVTKVSDHTGRYVEYEYDADDNLKFYHDPEGKKWTATYDDMHQIKTLEDPENIQTIENTYNALGEVTNQISATSNPWNFYFSRFRNIEEDPFGNQTIYHIDGKGRTWSIEKADGSRSYSIFDGQNHVISTINEAGVTNSFVYDVDHNLLTKTNALGTTEQIISTFGYNSEHHLRFSTNAVGTTEQTITEYTYTSEHKVDVITAAKGTALETVIDYNYYNSDGLVEQISEGNSQRITSYTYDSHGNPDTVASTDAGTVTTTYDIQGNLKSQIVDGKTATFGYNALNRMVATTNAFGTVSQTTTSKTYWENGLLKTSTDGRGKIAQYYWTDAYKPAGVVLPNTGSTTNLYDAADRLVMSRDPEGNWTTNVLDAVGRPSSVQNSLFDIQYSYDAVGNLTNSIVDPTGLNLWASTEYDALNRPLCIQNSLSDIHYSYDALGRATNRTDAASKNWKTEYDELGRVKKSFRPSGNYEEYGFDDLGNRTHFWNADDKPTTFGIDAQGRITSITNAIDKVTEFAFDDAGNLSQRIAADLKVTDYGYDTLNRLVAITNESVEVATFDHDPNGNLVEQTFQSAQSTFGYNEMNQLTASTQTVGSATSIVGYQHDLNGNRTHVTYPGNTNAVYIYGTDNRLESVDLSAFGISTAINFNYDTASRMTNIVYPNGVNSSFGFDAEGRMVSIKHGNFVDRTIQRNALGFKETELIDVGLKPTVPDTARRIKSHNDADQLTSEWVQQGTNECTVSYDYSENGCLTNVTSSVQNSVFDIQYSYDYDNRIKSATSAQSAVQYLYDASGARIGRIAGVSPATVATNYFIIDYTDGLKRPLAETDASGIITRYYVWSGSQLLCHIEAVAGVPDLGSVRYYHSDELGSTLALTDDTGAVTDEFAYMPYGYASHTAHLGSSDTPFQWLGGYGVYYDSDTDLHLTLYRAYSSKLKRFIHPDPLGIDGGVNVYAMANRNPLAFVDPYGLSANTHWEFHPENLLGPLVDWHYSRNAENEAGLADFVGRSDITMKEINARLPIYIPQAEAIFHRQGIENHNNMKFTSETSERYGKFELVVRPNPDGNTYTYVSDPRNMGTLNRGESKLSHTIKDVILYYPLGNSADDPSTMWERIWVPKTINDQERSTGPAK